MALTQEQFDALVLTLEHEDRRRCEVAVVKLDAPQGLERKRSEHSTLFDAIDSVRRDADQRLITSSPIRC
jgi:hypothetical protein